MRQSREWWLRWEERAEAWIPAIARKAVAGTSVLRPYRPHCWSIGRSNAQGNQRVDDYFATPTLLPSPSVVRVIDTDRCPGEGIHLPEPLHENPHDVRGEVRRVLHHEMEAALVDRGQPARRNRHDGSCART